MDETAQGPVYALVLAEELPMVDLSKSFRSKVLSPGLNAAIGKILKRFSKPLFLSYLLSHWCYSAMVILKAPLNQYFALLSVFFALPSTVVGFSGLRYDITCLVVRTFDFWSFISIATLTCLLCMTLVGDLRILRFCLDLFALLYTFLLDGQVHVLQHSTLVVISSIVPIFLLLVWATLGRIDGARSFTILEYENEKGLFKLESVDIICNGIVTIFLLYVKVSYRKTVLLRSKTTRVQCAILRARLRLQQVAARTRRQTSTESVVNSDTSSPCIKVGCAMSAQATILTIQQLQIARVDRTFVANCVIFPVSRFTDTHFPVWALFFLYSVGFIGLFLAFSIPIWPRESEKRNNQAQRGLAWIALISTLLFVVPFGSLYQRKLLRMLVFSFDFAFFSFQITSAVISVTMLYRCEVSLTVIMAAWWLWAHWALTLDALTPNMRIKFHLRGRYAAMVISGFLVTHVAIVSGIFFHAHTTDVILYEDLLGGHYVKISVVPYYFSRVATLLLWCIRLIWRLLKSSDDDVILIRGAVRYENCISKSNSKNSMQLQSSRSFTHRVQVSPTRLLPVTI